MGDNSEIGAVTVANISGATLTVADNSTAIIGTLNSDINSTIDFGTNGTLIIYQNSDGTFNGTLAGQGTLIKRGNSALIRFGADIESGTSSVND